MSLDLILNAVTMTFSVIVILLAFWVWNRATTSTRLFSIGVVAMIVSEMFRKKLGVFLMISTESPLWLVLDMIPYLFYTAALYSELGWRVINPKKQKEANEKAKMKTKMKR